MPVSSIIMLQARKESAELDLNWKFHLKKRKKSQVVIFLSYTSSAPLPDGRIICVSRTARVIQFFFQIQVLWYKTLNGVNLIKIIIYL